MWRLLKAPSETENIMRMLPESPRNSREHSERSSFALSRPEITCQVGGDGFGPLEMLSFHFFFSAPLLGNLRCGSFFIPTTFDGRKFGATQKVWRARSAKLPNFHGHTEFLAEVFRRPGICVFRGFH